MAQVKRFEDHSERWQREARRDGVNPQKWNAWRKLSSTTRNKTAPRDYGQGKSVRDQIRDPLVKGAVDRVAANARGNFVNRARLTKSIGNESTDELRRLNNLTGPKLRKHIEDTNATAKRNGSKSPYWYH